MVEIGFDQAAPVEQLFAQAGFRDIRTIRDINGKDRVIAAVLR
jgi:methylase of polypeptide subunit release factors